MFAFCSNRTTRDLITVTDNPDEDDWQMEEELQKLLLPIEHRTTIPPQYPYHLITLDDLDSLNVELNFNSDDWFWNYKCESPITRSFKIFLHRPDEIREAFNRPVEVEVGRKVIVDVKPYVIVTSNHLRRYSAKLRQCFYNSERRLKFFQVYTKSNCEHECLANFTQAQCGCVKFSMPRKSIDWYVFSY